MPEVLRRPFVKITRVSIVRFAFVMIMSVQASVSKGNRSFFDIHTGDRCSFGRYCCIAAVAPLLLHRFALFATSNCVQCRAFAPRCTHVFVTHLADSKKVSRLHVFYFEGRTCDRVSLASHSAISELVCVLFIAWFLVVSQQ